MVGQNPSDPLLSGRQPREFCTKLCDTLLGGNVWSGRHTNRWRDVTRCTEEQTITPVQDATGRLTHFIAIKRDATDRVQLEAPLQQSLRLESIGKLAGDVAHHCNNLLTVINGSVEMVLPQVGPSSDVADDL